MIARLYVLDSINYPKQAEYWLEYAHKLACKMHDACQDQNKAIKMSKVVTNLKRV